jgi:hypothetical protein
MAIPMKQRNLLMVLACSGSAALMLSLGSPADAFFNDVQDHGLNLNPVVMSESNPISDALGCGCATCQVSPIQSY